MHAFACWLRKELCEKRNALLHRSPHKRRPCTYCGPF
jgi:hypothetical protein